MTLVAGSKADIASPFRAWVGRVSPGSLPTPPCRRRRSERRLTAKLRSPARRLSHFPTTPGRSPRPARSLALGSTGAFRLTTAPTCPCLAGPPGLPQIGPRPTHLGLLLGGGEIRFRNGFSVGARFDGEFAENSTKYSGMGRLRYTW